MGKHGHDRPADENNTSNAGGKHEKPEGTGVPVKKYRGTHRRGWLPSLVHDIAERWCR